MKQLYRLSLIFVIVISAATAFAGNNYVNPKFFTVPPCDEPLNSIPKGSIEVIFPEYSSLIPFDQYVNLSTDKGATDLLRVEVASFNSIGIVVKEDITAAGTYTFHFDKDAIYAEERCGVEGDYFDAFDVVFVVVGAGVDDIASDDSPVDIYTTDGVAVARGASPAIISSLERGLYIINGKKTYVVK